MEDLAYWSAFWNLASDRPLIQGPPPSFLPIPFVVLDTYAKRHGIEGSDFDDFCEIVQALDALEREETSKQRTKQAS